MGYWLLLAIVLCALIAVIMAFTMEESEDGSQAHAPRRPSSPSSRQSWAALGSSGTAEGSDNEPIASWASHLTTKLPSMAIGRDLTASHATVAAVRQDQLPAVMASPPQAVALWIGLDDLLRGTPIETFEEDLLSILARLSAAGSALVLGTIPNLMGQPDLAVTGLTDEQLDFHVTRWNASLTRLGSAFGAVVIDGFDEPDDVMVRVRYLDEPTIVLSVRGHARLADRLQSLMVSLLEDERE